MLCHPLSRALRQVQECGWVEPHGPSAKNIGEMVLCTLHVFHSVVVYLKIGLYIQHPRVLDLCYILELEVFEATAIQKYLDCIVRVCSVEVAFSEAVLNCQ